MVRRVLVGIAVAMLALSMVVVRVLWSSRVELRDAEAHLVARDTDGAIDRFGRAARLYAPGSPYSWWGLRRLVDVAGHAQASGDRPTELAAWREIRSALLATRGLYTPHRDLLASADARIATLTAALESPSVDPGADEAARVRWHAERLARDDAPRVGWTLLALLGFAGWVGSAVGFFFRGLDERDRLRGRAALLFGSGVALGLALFLVGLAKA